MHDARRREQRDGREGEGAQALGPGKAAEEQPPREDRQPAAEDAAEDAVEPGRCARRSANQSFPIAPFRGPTPSEPAGLALPLADITIRNTMSAKATPAGVGCVDEA